MVARVTSKNLSHPSRRSTPNPRRLIQLQTLYRSCKTQPLWNQANPHSWACFFISPLATRPNARSQPRTFDDSTRSTVMLTIFRINTCKSVSKQRTLTIFRMNTYAKRGGRGQPLSKMAVDFQLSTVSPSITPTGLTAGNTGCLLPGFAGGGGVAAGRRCARRSRFRRC